MSPLCTSVSPGGAWVVLNLSDSARRQPGLAPAIRRATTVRDCSDSGATGTIEWGGGGKATSTFSHFLVNSLQWAKSVIKESSLAHLCVLFDHANYSQTFLYGFVQILRPVPARMGGGPHPCGYANVLRRCTDQTIWSKSSARSQHPPKY